MTRNQQHTPLLRPDRLIHLRHQQLELFHFDRGIGQRGERIEGLRHNLFAQLEDQNLEIEVRRVVRGQFQFEGHVA
jgi:hypothetical protein